MSDDAPLALQARGLCKHYERGAVRAVDQLDLDLERGEFVAVCGPSGCGKSTLLNLIAAIDRPTAGELTVAGRSLQQMTENEADAFRRHAVGLIFQLHNLLPDLTALENVQAPMLPAGRGPAERLEAARSLLARVRLEQRANALPGTLSGGERQRVAIARALANSPQLVLADEPTGALDSQSGERLLDLLQELQREQGVTLIVVTHDPSVAERAQRVLHMLDGRLASSTQPAPASQVGGR